MKFILTHTFYLLGPNIFTDHFGFRRCLDAFIVDLRLLSVPTIRLCGALSRSERWFKCNVQLRYVWCISQHVISVQSPMYLFPFYFLIRSRWKCRLSGNALVDSISSGPPYWLEKDRLIKIRRTENGWDQDLAG
jgi:hypothetical protein